MENRVSRLFCAIYGDPESGHFRHAIHFFSSCGGPIGLKFAPDLDFMSIWQSMMAFLKILFFSQMAAILSPLCADQNQKNGRHFRKNQNFPKSPGKRLDIHKI